MNGTAKPARGEFKQQANAICKEGNQEITATAQQVFGNLADRRERTE